MPQRVRNSGTARTGAFKRRPIRPRAIMERFLLLPLEEEGWLNDMPLGENFRAGVCRAVPPQANCTTAWTQMLDDEPTPGGLVKFHTGHKLTREAVRELLRAMAHGPS